MARRTEELRMRLLSAVMNASNPSWPGQCRGGLGPASCSPRCVQTFSSIAAPACTSCHHTTARSGIPFSVRQLAAASTSLQPNAGFAAAGVLRGRAVHTCPALSSSAVAAVQQDADDNDPELCPGRLVEIKRDARAGVLAYVERADGKRNWLVHDCRGTVASLRPQQITYVLPGLYKPEQLQDIDQQAQQDANAELLQLAWEVSEETQLYNVAQMAALLFGDAVQPSQLYAAHRLLTEDHIWFKQAARLPPLFQPRPQKEVDMLVARKEAERKAEEELAQMVAVLKAGITVPVSARPSAQQWKEGSHAAWINMLEAFAFGTATPDQQRESIKVLNAMGMTTIAPTAAKLMRQIGVWGFHDLPELLQSGLLPPFPSHLQAEAQSLIDYPPKDPDSRNRMDLTHLEVITIDDSSTREIDDGVSVEWRQEGDDSAPRYWIHVADPTRWLETGGPLDLEARRRCKTLYLPTGACFMFPDVLATGPFSLRHGEQCCALSIGVDLNTDGSIREQVITPSLISVGRRCTYAEVDQVLEDESSEQQQQRQKDIHVLHAAAQLRNQWRRDQGAVVFNVNSASVKVRDAHLEQPTITIEPDQQDTNANRLVAEMMILAGEAAGRHGKEAGLPMPYRAQAAGQLPTESELAQVPAGLCREVLIRSRMLRSVTTIKEPLPHASLGLQHYVQITSPIRRYNDLLAHWQLKAHLRGVESPLSADDLADAVAEASENLREWGTLEKKSRDYWTALYFAEHQGPMHPGLMLSWYLSDRGLAKVMLQDLGMEVIATVNTPAKAGDQLNIICSQVDVASGIVRFSDTFVAGQPPDGSQATPEDPVPLEADGAADQHP
ncbi:hypothetical protein WJX73_007247 [Symbiochloris irregularis]|uniref:RNB domain-containing protein n=1 Tax=Symbiochloris irregularis TaxID=706552 RepID=A0AAW1PAF3_9CHLO